MKSREIFGSAIGKGRRGQAAVEYLITYGWVLLIVVLVVIAMWNAGFFKLSTYACSKSEAVNLGVVKIDGLKATESGQVYLSVKNAEEAAITITALKIDGVAPAGLSPALPQTIAVGGNASFSGTVASLVGSPGDTKGGVPIEFTYDVSGGASGHKDAGVMCFKLEVG